jgi:hypothetical protein
VRRRLALTLAVLTIIIIAVVAVPLVLPGRKLAALQARAKTEIEEESRRVERIPALRGEAADGDLLDRIASVSADFPHDPRLLSEDGEDLLFTYERHVLEPLHGGRLHPMPRKLAPLRADLLPLLPRLREALAAERVAPRGPGFERFDDADDLADQVKRLMWALRIEAFARLFEGHAEEAARLWTDKLRLWSAITRERAQPAPYPLEQDLILACIASAPDDASLARLDRELALLEEGLPRLADLVRRVRLHASSALLSFDATKPTDIARVVRDWTAIDLAFRQAERDLDRLPPSEVLARPKAAEPIAASAPLDAAAETLGGLDALIRAWVEQASVLRALRVLAGAERFRRKHGRPPSSSEEALGEPCTDPLTGKPMRFAAPFEDVLSAGEERLDVDLRRPRLGPRDTIWRLDLEDMDLRDFARVFSGQTGHTVFVAPEVNEKVTLSLARLPWRRAIDIVARRTKCEVAELPRGTLFLYQPPRVTIQFSDASLRVVLQLLAAYSGRNIVLPPGDLGGCTTDIHEVIWSRALRQLAWGARLDLVSLPPRHDVILASRAPLWRPPLFLVAEHACAALPDLGGLAPRERLVDFEAYDRDLGRLLGELRESLGIELRLDPDVHEKVTLVLCEAPWEDALAAVALVTHTQVRREGDALVFGQPPKVTIQASGCPASAWFELVGRALGRRVVVPSDLPGALTFDVKEIAFEDMLRVASSAFGYDVVAGDEIRIGAGRALPAPPRAPRAIARTERVDLAALSERVGRFEATRALEDGVGAGNALLGSMAKDVHAERYEAALATVALVDSLLNVAKDVRDDELARNMDAIHVRSKALAEQARKSIEVRALGVDVRAIIIDPRPGKLDLAVVNGRIVTVGDALPGHPDVTIVKINDGTVRLHRADVEFVAELKAPD